MNTPQTMFAWAVLIFLACPVPAVDQGKKANRSLQLALDSQTAHAEVSHNAMIHMASRPTHERTRQIRHELREAGQPQAFVAKGIQLPARQVPYVYAYQGPPDQRRQVPNGQAYPISAGQASQNQYGQAQDPYSQVYGGNVPVSSGPRNLEEARLEVTKFDTMVSQAEQRAGLPDSVHTTPEPLPVDKESEAADRALLWGAVFLVVVVGIAASGYSIYLHNKASELEALVKGHLPQQPSMASQPALQGTRNEFEH